MPFYKRFNEELLSTASLDGPGFSLSEASKDEYTYPVDDWYWFADLNAAMQGMQTFIKPDGVCNLVRTFINDTYEEMMKEVRGRA